MSEGRTSAEGSPPRWRSLRALVAWALVAGFAAAVLFLGSDSFNATSTRGVIGPLLEFFLPDLSPGERFALHVKLRKAAHMVEYGILAVLAFRAAFVSFETALARTLAIALVLTASVAATDEARQAFSAVRTGSPWDVLLDLTGATLALLLVWLVRRFWRRPAPGAAPP